MAHILRVERSLYALCLGIVLLLGSPAVAQAQSKPELAVAAALEWLAAHQAADGGWSFNQGQAPHHQGAVNDAGNGVSRTAATGWSLLPFAGAGQTQADGKYQARVKAGLKFLVSQAQPTANGLDLRGGGDVQDHAIATLALIEHYALTQDKTLAEPAQGALDYLVHQQQASGGWGRTAAGPAELTVTTHAVLALVSGHLAYLKLDPKPIAKLITYLKSLETGDGAFYGNEKPGKEPLATAAGLLCRSHLGWHQEEPALQRGVEYLLQLDPPPASLEYDYLLAQLLQRYPTPANIAWRQKLRERLTAQQIVGAQPQGEGGSWTPTEHSTWRTTGGRLQETCLATLTLEIYYRTVARIQAKAALDDF